MQGRLIQNKVPLELRADWKSVGNVMVLVCRFQKVSKMM